MEVNVNVMPCLAVAFSTVMILTGCGSMMEGVGGPVEEYKETVDETVGDGKISGLKLRNVNGDVTIILWENPNVRVVAEKTVRARTAEEAEAYAKEKVKVKIEQKGKTIEVITQTPTKRPRNVKSASVKYTLRVPKLAMLNASTVNGDVNVKDAMAEDSAQVSLATTNGDVSLRGAAGRIKIGTKNGDISLAQVVGGIQAKTVNGSISATLARAGDSASSLDTTNGSITLKLPADASVDIEASCVNGRIESDLPIVVKGEIKRKRLRGKLNGGGATIKIATVNGSVRIGEAK